MEDTRTRGTAQPLGFSSALSFTDEEILIGEHPNDGDFIAYRIIERLPTNALRVVKEVILAAPGMPDQPGVTRWS